MFAQNLILGAALSFASNRVNSLGTAESKKGFELHNKKVNR